LQDAIYNTEFKGGEFKNNVAKTTGQPVLDSKELGYYLVDENYFDIKGKDGKSVYYPIADIWNTRKAKVTAINKKASGRSVWRGIGD